MIATPDTDPADLDAVIRAVEAAGAAVTGRISLTESFVDAAGADQLRTTVTNVVPAGVQLQTGAVDQGSLAGDLLGAVLLVDPANAQPRSTPQERDLALSTLRGGGFVAYDDGTVEPAQAAIVVTGDGKAGAEAGGNRGALLARFTAAVDTVDRESGRITTVLALQEQLAGVSGRYGTGPNAGAVTVGTAAR